MKTDLLHTAIASWAGYIYQGLCGIYHVLTLLKEDKDTYKDYSLSLDSYEDFSILDNAGLVISLHQCKDVKGKQDFSDEQEKMKEKYAQYQQKGWLAKGCTMFFHSANDISCLDNIRPYIYCNGDSFCRPNDILRLIGKVLKDLLPDDMSINLKVAKLAAMIDTKVLEVHGLMHNNSEAQKYVAQRKALISFSSIIDLIFRTVDFSLHEGDFFAFVRSSYCMEWLSIMSCDDDPDYEEERGKIYQYMEHLARIDSLQGKNLLVRLSPHEDVQFSFNSIFRMVSPEKAQALYQVLADVMYSLDAHSFDWFVKGCRLTPTSIQCFDYRDLKRICRAIINNRANLDCLREYDFLVGRVNNPISSISEETGLFNQLNEKSDEGKGEKKNNNIFEIKKIGITNAVNVNNGEL